MGPVVQHAREGQAGGSTADGRHRHLCRQKSFRLLNCFRIVALRPNATAGQNQHRALRWLKFGQRQVGEDGQATSRLDWFPAHPNSLHTIASRRIIQHREYITRLPIGERRKHKKMNGLWFQLHASSLSDIASQYLSWFLLYHKYRTELILMNRVFIDESGLCVPS